MDPRSCLAARLAVLLGIAVCGCGKTAVEPKPAAPAAAPSAVAAIKTKTGIEMVLIPGGEFTMGQEAGEDDERPLRRVRVGDFYMDLTEVTQASYQELLGKNPSKAVAADKPVERVSWVSAVQYCNMRSLREGLKPCYDSATLTCDFSAEGYRLPTEAEWEYACRAGTTGRWSCGDDPAKLVQCAWFKQNSEKSPRAVRQKQPNAWGLYDMHGNVAEWCHDFYAESYDAAQVADPTGPESGEERVLRGGSWKTSEDRCRSAARFSETPAFADACFGTEEYGFRCVRRAAQP